MKISHYIEQNKWLGITLNIIPVFIAFIYVLLWSVNMPFLHDWIFLHHILDFDPSDWLNQFWRTQNGHRNFFPQLIYLFILKYFNFNTLFLVWLNFSFILGTYLLFWKLFSEEVKNSYFSFIPISWLIFSLVQYGNLLVAWQLSLNLSIFSSLLTFYLIRKTSWLNFFLSIVTSIISVGSFGNGLILMPIVFFYLLFNAKNRLKTIIWLIFGIIIIGFYFFNYNSSSVATSFNGARIYVFLTNLLSNTILLPIGKTGGKSLILGTIIGTIVLVISVFQILYFISSQKWKVLNHSFSYILIYFTVIIIQITLGRSGNELKGAYGTQYTTFIVLFFVSLYVIQHNNTFTKLFSGINKFFFSSIILMTILVGGGFGLIMGPYLYGRYLNEKSILLNFNSYPTGIQAQIKGMPPEVISSTLKYFHENNTSIFSSSYRVFMNPYMDNEALTEAKTSQKYFIADTLVFSFASHVDKIENISINSFVAKPYNSDSLIIIMVTGSNIIVRHSFSSVDLYFKGRAFFSLDDIIIDNKGNLKLILIRKGNSIKIPSYSYFSLSPVFNTGDRKGDVIGMEINTPQRLEGYYFTKAIRNRVKYWLFY
ncbi:MAG: hypothetical protein AB9834_16390 [Lentimicrobium sp.]